MAVDADGNEIGQRCDQLLDSPFYPCQGQSESPPVSLQEQQVTSSDSYEGSRRCLMFLRSRSTVTMKKRLFFAAESYVID